jgi:hypothetical protein
MIAQLAWDSISLELVNTLMYDFHSRLQSVEVLDGQSLNGHREVHEMLSSGRYTVDDITQMRKQEDMNLLQFKCDSWTFFRD